MEPPLTINDQPNHGPPDDDRVTYVPATAICQECRTPFALPTFDKCPKCLAADSLPASLVKFGELVRPIPLVGSGDP